MTWQIHTGDCIEEMAKLDEASVDAVVCDPPYSLGFMGRSWDSHGEGEDAGFGYYLAGLIDGEGHFRVGAGERRCEFGMKLRDDDRWILERARAFIGHGRINTEPRRDGSAPQAKLIIDSKDGCAALCAVLMRYPLRAKKLRDFLTWAEAVDEWLTMPRGNRWHGPADRARLAELGERLRSERVYSEVPWSGNAFQDWCRRWGREALRVLKPGGHLLAFGGTRTSHRLVAGIEDAGFEIRDSILAWGFGSGFPKSLSPYRRMTPCPSIESAPHAVRLSEWLPHGSREGRAPTALALVEMQPEGDLAVAIRTGRADGSLALTVTSLSDFLTADTNSSIASSWSECSGAPWSPASKSTIETATKAITDRRTWKSSALPPTPAITTQGESSPGGCGCHVATVASRSSGGRWSLTDTQRLIATERVTSPLAALKPLGTALKPSFEPIVVARKPLIGTVAENVQTHGTGALNIDGCRIGTSKDVPASPTRNRSVYEGGWRDADGGEYEPDTDGWNPNVGRWPANIVLSHTEDCVAVGTKQVKPMNGWECAPNCPVAELDRQSGRRAAGVRKGMGYHGANGDGGPAIEGDAGGASRFFYTAKTSRAEREAGLDGFALKTADPYGEHRGRRMEDKSRFDGEPAKVGRNHHPTVKPINLMRWLVRLVTPPGGRVLDPFTGSGSTGCAAVLEGFDFIGCEREPEYVAIAEARIAFWAQHVGREVDDVLGLVGASTRETRRHEAAGQIGLEIHA